MSRAHRGRREIAEIGLSFLDVISCGFGAVILLLMITRVADPAPELDALQQLAPTANALQVKLYELRQQTQTSARSLTERQQTLAELQSRLAALEQTRNSIRRRLAELQAQRAQADATRANLATARQRLDETMKRLLERAEPEASPAVGGIPVDSEYVIFVIDTSGSMRATSWEILKRQVREVLTVYPALKGFQVMDSDGNYMFPGLAGTWIEDTPQRREVVFETLQTWSSNSSSTPVRGILTAIRTFWSEDRRISLYVMGDDFQGVEIDPVVSTVDRINPRQPDGNRRVRIHGIGFPGVIGSNAPTVIAFAALMRELAHRNDGTFVALTR